MVRGGLVGVNWVDMGCTFLEVLEVRLVVVRVTMFPSIAARQGNFRRVQVRSDEWFFRGPVVYAERHY